jgi:hypothetical protein
MTATGLLSHWDDRVAASLFAENVALDVPLDERRTAAEAAVAAVGGIAEVASGRATPVCDSPDHLVWFVEGERGRLRLEVRMTPVLPLRVQTFGSGQPIESSSPFPLRLVGEISSVASTYSYAVVVGPSWSPVFVASPAGR